MGQRPRAHVNQALRVSLTSSQCQVGQKGCPNCFETGHPILAHLCTNPGTAANAAILLDLFVQTYVHRNLHVNPTVYRKT